MSDRPLLQGLIDAAVAAGQRHVTIPSGTYVVDHADSAWWCLRVPSNATGLQIHGEGVGRTVIRQASGPAPSVRTFVVQASDVGLDSLSLEGGDQQDPDAHRAGVFAMGPRLRVTDVVASGFTGDGIYLYAGADGATIDRCVCSGNLRNGITLGASLGDVKVMRSQFVGNHAQQFDTEPGMTSVVSRLLVSDCLMDAQGASGDYVLTLGGSSVGAPGRDVLVSQCTLNGPTFLVWGERVSVLDCGGDNPTSRPAMTVYRSSRDVEIARCSFRSQAAPIGMLITGTGSGSCPERVRVVDTAVQVGAAGIGLALQSVMGVELVRVSVAHTGSSTPSSVGISVRATNPSQDARLVRIDSCNVSGFAGYGIQVTGNAATAADGTRSAARLDRLEVSRTSVTDAATPMLADDGTGVLRELATGPGNSFEPIVVAPVTRVIDSD